MFIWEISTLLHYQQLATKGTGHSNGSALQAMESIGNGFPYA